MANPKASEGNEMRKEGEHRTEFLIPSVDLNDIFSELIDIVLCYFN